MKPVSELIREKIVWGAWCVFDADLATDERAQWVKDLGLDFVYFGFDAERKNAIPALDMCEKYGLGMLPFDAAVENLPMDRFWCLKDMVKVYASHPALLGNVLRDEPGVYDLPRLKLLAETYQKETGKCPAINLFPSYANEQQLNYVTYPEYIERCAAELPIPYLSYDHYPLYGPNGETWVQEHYYFDFEVVAEACRKYGKDMWYFIQTLGFNHIVREPNEQDMRWQVYCALSFGSRVIQLFTYGSPGDENGDTASETFELALIDRKGQKTPRYEMARRVIAEADRFGGVYVTYKPVGVMLHRAGRRVDEETREVEITFPGRVIRRRIKDNYLELFHALDGFDPIVSIGGDKPVLAGCFERDGARAFTLVNAEDPGKRTRCSASVEFSRPVTLRVWANGEPSEVEVRKSFSYDLDCGQGLFIEILK